MMGFQKTSRLFLLLFCCGLMMIRLPTTTNAFQTRFPANNNMVQRIKVSGKNMHHKTVEGKRLPSFKTNYPNYNHYHTTKLSAATTDDENQSEEKKATLLGTLVLLTVPISWGTYVPVVRYLYEIQPPVPGFVFSACYYTLAAVTTSILARRVLQPPPAQEPTSTISSSDVNEVLGNDDSPKESSFFSLNNGGMELGSYLFVANCLQVIGLQTVESDRAGFLVQLTTVMVPICEGLFAGNILLIPARTWGACVMAFSGLCIMGLDGKQTDVIDAWSSGNPWETFQVASSSLSQGDCLILGAAVLYTLHVVRLGTYARQTTPMKLAASKATTESILSFGLLCLLVGLSILQDSYHMLGDNTSNDGLLMFSIDTGREITSFFSSFTAGISDGSISTSVLLPALGSILWTGWITCAYTIWAQSFGQSKVSPTSANLIYTFQPIFTALFAYVLLGEKMGSVGFLGGAIIASAVYVVASNDDENTKSDIGKESL
uniref:EamA domain-containing protein n=1 Tax=Pseudo-nitzschia australis TaxID=44445 RepID=A0A7S4ANE6_9STRA|mmetsp:Transcript_28572/g.59852  ORF Transcript_28572/g.59852 Transcript_28572/m.59852 type:complete len:489 (+) Transcript_28572:142-1608(+)